MLSTHYSVWDRAGSGFHQSWDVGVWDKAGSGFHKSWDVGVWDLVCGIELGLVFTSHGSWNVVNT